MNDNSVAQDELQQAINSITNAANADANDSSDAVAQIENRLNGNKAAAKSAQPEKAKKEEKVEKPADIPAPLAPPIPAPAAPEPPAMPTFANGIVSPIGSAPKQAAYGDPDLDRVKSSALSDLRPIIAKIELPAEKKFEVYKEIISSMNDKACIEPAYNSAKNIADEKERAEALLFVIEAINRLGIQEVQK
jgi:hypothetical protein